MQTDWIYTPYAIVLHITALAALGIAIFLMTRRNMSGADMFLLMMAAVSLWAFTAGNEAASVSLSNKILWAKIEYLGAVFTPTLFFLFTLEYRQMRRFLAPRYLILYSIIPLIALAMVATNESHQLIWTGFLPGPEGTNSYIYQHGPGFFGVVIYDYLLVFVSLSILIRAWFREKSPYRQQIGSIIVGALCPILCSLLYVLNISPFPGLDMPPISFLTTGLIITVGIFRFKLFNLTPIARHELVEHMNDGLLVINNQRLLTDINPAAERYLAIRADQVVGQPVEHVLPKWFNLDEFLTKNHETQIEMQSDGMPPRHFDLRVRPLHQKGKLNGHLVLIHDITQRRTVEKELSRQNEELNIINRISLAVASGLDMEQTIKTLQQQCSMVMPVDIFYVALYDEKRALIHVPVYYERGEYRSGLLRDINDNPGSLGAIIRTGRTLYLRDSYNSVTRPLNEKPEEKRIRSYLGIPLVAREKIVGAIVIQSYRPVAYREEQVNLMERIAVHAAIAIENARLYAEVQRLAIVDELTRIYNYRGFLELGKREVERSKRFNHPLSALFFDIDNFRNFNNRYSHSTGNVVLQMVVQTVSEVLRSVDIFSRFGGDEFVIFLPETDIDNAYHLARRIYDRVASIEIPIPNEILKITISIGIAALDSETQDFDSLIEKANQAEHVAKSRGLGISIYGRGE